MSIDFNNVNREKIAAWAVHGFTGSGAVLGLLAIISIINDEYLPCSFQSADWEGFLHMRAQRI